MQHIDSSSIQSPSDANNAPATHTIFITDLLVDMVIGIYEQEKVKTQPVRLNIEMTVIDHKGPINDNYDNVVCYEATANSIKALAAKGHINLVETLADDIADICLAHPRVVATKVKVEKLQAIENTVSVGIEIKRNKET